MIRFARFLALGNYIIAGIAAGLAWQTCLLLKVASCFLLVAGIFFLTLAGYSLHYLLLYRNSNTGEQCLWIHAHRKAMILQTLIATIGGLLCFYSFPAFYINILIATLVFFLYSAPQLISKWTGLFRLAGLLKPFLLVTGWSFSITFLVYPHFYSDAVLLFLLRFFMALPVALLFDFRDRQKDKTQGIYTFSNTFHPSVNQILITLFTGLYLFWGIGQATDSMHPLCFMAR